MLSPMDREEKEWMVSVEKGEWKPAGLSRRDFQRYLRYARNTLRKSHRINVRMSQGDLEALQTRAVAEGIPYQTLITSILHKYISGRLKAA